MARGDMAILDMQIDMANRGGAEASQCRIRPRSSRPEMVAVHGVLSRASSGSAAIEVGAAMTRRRHGARQVVGSGS